MERGRVVRRERPEMGRLAVEASLSVRNARRRRRGSALDGLTPCDGQLHNAPLNSSRHPTTGGPGHTRDVRVYTCCFVLDAFMLQNPQNGHVNACCASRCSRAVRNGRWNVSVTSAWW